MYPLLFDLPSLGGDLSLEVFTHHSLMHDSSHRRHRHGDNKCLAILGEHTLKIAVVFALFNSETVVHCAEDIMVSTRLVPFIVVDSFIV